MTSSPHETGGSITLGAAAGPAGPRRPNILLITTDQQRGDCLGVERSAHPVMTPHLDQIAAEGIRFTRAYSDCPVCIPARTSIMTGRCAYTHGITGNADRPLPEDPHLTLPGRLSAAGYQTHAVGKMHFSPPRRRNGFERMRLLPEDYSNWLESTPYPGGYRSHGLGGNEVFPVFSALPNEYTATRWIVDESIDFLRQRDAEAPFFMWTSFEAPHPPYEALEQFVRLYERTEIPTPVMGDWAAAGSPSSGNAGASATGAAGNAKDAGTTGNTLPYPVQHRRWTHNLDTLTPTQIDAARRHYYAQITHVDYELGRLFGELNAQRLWQDTVIIFTSDHGEMLGDHGSFHKSFFYEPSARVPFLLRIPPRYSPPAPAGSAISQPVLLADIYPTCLALASLSPDQAHPSDATRDGQNLLSPTHYANTAARWVFGLCGASHGMYFATNGHWKYLYYAWGGTEQLFNLTTDPTECHNLAASGDSDPAARAALAEARDRLRKEIPQIAAPASPASPDASATSATPSTPESQDRPFVVANQPPPDEATARAANPFAWRGPIRYGGHW